MALCEAAGEFGLSMNREFTPQSELRDLAAALRVLRSANQPNQGVIIDALACPEIGNGHRRDCFRAQAMAPLRPDLRCAGGDPEIPRGPESRQPVTKADARESARLISPECLPLCLPICRSAVEIRERSPIRRIVAHAMGDEN